MKTISMVYKRFIEWVWGEDITADSFPELLEKIGCYFGEDFSSVTFRRGGILPHVVPFPYVAIVFGETVNVRRGAEFVLGSPRVVAEECYHVLQWRRLGVIRMAVKYLFFTVTRGYDNNPLEMEAKKQASEFLRETEEYTS
ncbi:MAG: hypothetical protein JW885_17065 [Deltaproteobacteria bacterium]|nr:hypothetical protein [Candidatus Zymogenaceae bacterium]